MVDWVACDKCDHWHKLPEGVTPGELPDPFTCREADWQGAEDGCGSESDESDVDVAAVLEAHPGHKDKGKKKRRREKKKEEKKTKKKKKKDETPEEERQRSVRGRRQNELAKSVGRGEELRPKERARTMAMTGIEMPRSPCIFVYH